MACLATSDYGALLVANAAAAQWGGNRVDAEVGSRAKGERPLIGHVSMN